MQKLSQPVRVTGSLLLAVVLLVLAMPRSVKFGYDYRKGRVWNHETLISKFDFPILKTEEQMLQERENADLSLIPYYVYSSDVVNASLSALNGSDLGDCAKFKPGIAGAMKSIYEKGVLPDEGVVQLGQATSEILYVQKDKRAEKTPVSEVYTLTAARRELRSAVLSDSGSARLDSILTATGVYDLLLPNLKYDKVSTDLVHFESDRAISPTMGYVSAGQLIVSNGEIVTAEIAQMLDSYKKEYDSNIGYDGPKLLYWLGNLLIALALVAMFFFAVYLPQKKNLGSSAFFYMLLLFLMASALAFFVGKEDNTFLLLVPFTVFALFLQAFFKPKVILPVYAVCLLPLLVFTRSGLPMYVMYLLAGMVSTWLFKYFGKGWKQFILALITFAVLMLTSLGFRMLGMFSGNLVRMSAFLFIGSMLTVAGYPLVYLFEKIFDLVSTSRLDELSNTNNPLLRKLELLAPGTFQHSLQVMNMSVSAVRAIRGDVALARAGALYHDIGKTENPQCFVENESLVALDDKSKYHENLPPLQSALDIIRHVSDGEAIARREKLPQVVTDFILSHHGTTRASFFYDKYLSQGGDPSRSSEFEYKGFAPRTKEQVVVMICDSIEAASRTLKKYDAETYDKFVEQIVSSKMAQGQFEQAEISLRELAVVKSVIKSYLAQIYHERIAYPKKSTK